jgi:peptide/nickel transport system substrate-binding protein
VNVKKWPAESYWSEVWLKKNFYVTFWSGRATPDIILTQGWMTNSPWNDGHFKDPDFDELVVSARSTGDAAERTDLYTQALTLVHDHASTIIPAFQNLVHASQPNVAFKVPPAPAAYVNLQEAGFTA